MKRQLNGAPAKRTQVKSNVHSTKSQVSEAASPGKKAVPWDSSQDRLLIELATPTKGKTGRKKVSWLNVCKKMNKTFPNSRHTAKDCQMRFRELSQKIDPKGWSINEELIFLCALHMYGHAWLEQVSQFLSKTKENLLEHFSGKVQAVL